MNTKLSHLLLATALTGAASAQTPANFDYGYTLGGALGSSTNWLEVQSMDQVSGGPTGAYSAAMSAWNGSINLYSAVSLNSRINHDGGINLLGNSLNMILRTDDDLPNQDTGEFNVWRASDFYGSPSLTPLFQVSSVNDTATFDHVDVVIKDGTLTVGTSPVVTQASAPTFLGGLTPPTTTSWTTTYLTRGNVSNGAALSFGSSATSASGLYSMSLGHGSTSDGQAAVAIGQGASAGWDYSFAQGLMTSANRNYARAMGSYSTASYDFAVASGDHATSDGKYSFAHGLYTSAKSTDEVALGRYNLESSPGGGNVHISYSGLDGLFRLGNGTSTTRSDAMTVLKSGQTSLTNKEWKAAYTATPTTETALANPASTTDSEGNALVVDGHTILNGKVVITVPQGNISMGIYE